MRLAVEQFGADAETIAERLDHYQQERQISPGFAPIHRAKDLDRDFSHLTGGEAVDFRYGDGIVLEDLLRGGRLRPIEARAASGAVALRKRQV